jgi:hypothetical protein
MQVFKLQNIFLEFSILILHLLILPFLNKLEAINHRKHSVEKEKN